MEWSGEVIVSHTKDHLQDHVHVFDSDLELACSRGYDQRASFVYQTQFSINDTKTDIFLVQYKSKTYTMTWWSAPSAYLPPLGIWSTDHFDFISSYKR